MKIDMLRRPVRPTLLAALLGVGVLLLIAASPHTAVASGFDCAAVTGIDDGDCAALAALHESTDGDNWLDDTNWGSGAPCNTTEDVADDWFGISCTGDRVTEISLEANNLIGPLPAQLGNLSELQMLILGENGLTGEIPAQIFSLNKLIMLRLGNNQLEGGIPSRLSEMSALQWLYLNQNKFSGEIPKSLGDLSNLYLLYLHGNMLDGEIPAELCDPPNLSNINVGYNLLELEAIPAGECPDPLDSNWRSTQTLPPDPRLDSVPDVSRNADDETVTIVWDQIPFSVDGLEDGFIQVFQATTSGGYGSQPAGRTSKYATEITIGGLTTGEEYFFVLQTVSYKNGVNPNQLKSELSRELSTGPVALTLTDFQVAAGDWGLLAPLALVFALLLLSAGAVFLRRQW